MKKKDKILVLEDQLKRASDLLWGCTLRLSKSGYDGQHREICLKFIDEVVKNEK